MTGGPHVVALPSREWMLRAACAGRADVEFVPDKKAEACATQMMCAGCPVDRDCLAYGLRTHAYGVWGGEWLVGWKPS